LSTDAPAPSDDAPAKTAWTRSWALSLSWGWLALLVAGALAVAFGLVGLSDALDVPARLAAPDAATTPPAPAGS
jgi:hypothetical protein